MNFYNMPQLGKQGKYKHKTLKIKLTAMMASQSPPQSCHGPALPL
jgi:hypothetical protein